MKYTSIESHRHSQCGNLGSIFFKEGYSSRGELAVATTIPLAGAIPIPIP
jgi:hypothetical protein